MFSKKQRLNSEELKKIFESKIRSESTDLFLVKKTENNLDFNRFAVIVPKSVYKTAVGRHQTKRKVINILKEIEINGNFDFVISLRKKIGDFDTAKEKLVKILN